MRHYALGMDFPIHTRHLWKILIVPILLSRLGKNCQNLSRSGNKMINVYIPQHIAPRINVHSIKFPTPSFSIWHCRINRKCKVTKFNYSVLDTTSLKRFFKIWNLEYNVLSREVITGAIRHTILRTISNNIRCWNSSKSIVTIVVSHHNYHHSQHQLLSPYSD